MLDRLTIRASDVAASRRFYDAVLPELGASAVFVDLVIVPATDAQPVTRGLHVGLVAASREHVDAFWTAGTRAGFASDGPPGLRPQYADDYYGGFLLDPDGNSIEAVHMGQLRQGGLIDHLWIRVEHLAMTRRSYEAASAQAGDGDAPGYLLDASDEASARFRAPDGSTFTIVASAEPTRGLDLQLGAARFLDDDGRNLKLRASSG